MTVVRRFSNRVGAPLVCFLLTVSQVGYASPGASGVLFVTSNPSGARVIVDGVELAERTPVVLRDLPPGSVSLRLELAGYVPHERVLEVPEDVVRSVEVAFSPDTMGEGSYLARSRGDTLTLTPEYPRRRVVEGLRLAVPIVALVAGALTVSEMVSPRDTALPVSIELLTAGALTAGLLSIEIVLNTDRTRFWRAAPVRNVALVSREPGTEPDKRMFQTAESAAAAGDFAGALRLYQLLAELHPSSIYVPEALYRVAQTHLMHGNYADAEQALVRVVEEYPTPAVYDRALRALADLYEIQDRNADALQQIEAMAFADESISAEHMRERRDALRKRVDGGGRGVDFADPRLVGEE